MIKKKRTYRHQNIFKKKKMEEAEKSFVHKVSEEDSKDGDDSDDLNRMK